jgi:hypothetical protein
MGGISGDIGAYRRFRSIVAISPQAVGTTGRRQEHPAPEKDFILFEKAFRSAISPPIIEPPILPVT